MHAIARDASPLAEFRKDPEGLLRALKDADAVLFEENGKAVALVLTP